MAGAIGEAETMVGILKAEAMAGIMMTIVK